jgi:hypothetical protein
MNYLGWKRGVDWYMDKQDVGRTLFTLAGVEHMMSVEQKSRGDNHGISTAFVSPNIFEQLFSAACLS